MAEVLESECAVEMDKLATLCRLGIPERLRAEAWKYLLGVTRPEKAQELSLGKLMEQRYLRLERAWQSDPQLELTRRIKAEVRGHNAAAPHLRSRQRLERLLRTYLHCHAADYTSGMLHLLAPFEHVYRDSDTDAYFGFEGLMGQLSWALTFEGRKQMAVALLTLLRHLLPELYAHLEAEERLTTGTRGAETGRDWSRLVDTSTLDAQKRLTTGGWRPSSPIHSRMCEY